MLCRVGGVVLHAAAAGWRRAASGALRERAGAVRRVAGAACGVRRARAPAAGGRGRCAGQWRAARAADARTAVSSRSPPCPARASHAPPDSMALPTATTARSHALTTVRIAPRARFLTGR